MNNSNKIPQNRRSFPVCSSNKRRHNLICCQHSSPRRWTATVHSRVTVMSELIKENKIKSSLIQRHAIFHHWLASDDSNNRMAVEWRGEWPWWQVNPGTTGPAELDITRLVFRSPELFVSACSHTDANQAHTGGDMSRHLRFIARTVMVQQSNVDAAYKTLTR